MIETRFSIAIGMRQRDPELGGVQFASGTDSSVWVMPWPAVIRLSSPDRMTCSLPRLSRCRISPDSIQVKVCKLVWGCGPTRKPSLPAEKTAGPAWSRKHQAPIIRRWRCGMIRLTGMLPTSTVRGAWCVVRDAGSVGGPRPPGIRAIRTVPCCS